MIISQIEFRVYLQTTAKAIENELIVLSKEQNHIDSSEIKMLQKRFRESWFGGKMLRGTLVKLGYELVNERKTAAIFKPACALEILHTSLLIHDDIIDKSKTRRGKPAIHIHRNNHYGISQAICLGDFGISKSGKLIAESEFPTEKKNRALNYFFEMVNQTILGQMMDIASALMINRTEKEVLQIHRLKTANYTLVGPLTLGAILAGAGDDLLTKIRQFAEPLGVAYQIQDDILGIFGNEKELGKSTSSDIEENKSTLLIIYALKHGDKKQQKMLKNLYGKEGITQQELEAIKKIFLETGALAYSQNKVAKLTEQAKKIIASIPGNKNKKLLMQLCDFLLQRKI